MKWEETASAYSAQSHVMLNGRESVNSRNGSHEWLWLKKILEEKRTQQRVRKVAIAKKGKEMHIRDKTEMISYHTSGVQRGMAV